MKTTTKDTFSLRLLNVNFLMLVEVWESLCFPILLGVVIILQIFRGRFEIFISKYSYPVVQKTCSRKLAPKIK